MSLLHRVSMGIVLLAWYALASAQIVECVDANGKKSYMQVCPDGTVSQRAIEPLPPVKAGSSPDASAQKLQESEKEFEKRRAERLKAAATASEKEQKSTQDRQSCTDDRRRLEALQTGRPSRRIDPDTGEHIAMDENERQAEIERLQARIQALGEACP